MLHTLSADTEDVFPFPFNMAMIYESLPLCGFSGRQTDCRPRFLTRDDPGDVVLQARKDRYSAAQGEINDLPRY